MPHPFTIHTVEGWDEVRRKAENYDWAKDRKERYIQDAKAWIVPLRPPYVANGDGIPYLCATTHEHGLMNNAIAWQLTRSPEYARKVKQFLLMISDYQNGFAYSESFPPVVCSRGALFSALGAGIRFDSGCRNTD